MSSRIAYIPVLACATICAAACSEYKEYEKPLPPLEAPIDLTPREEPMYLRAQAERYQRDVGAKRGMNFDFRRHVQHQFYFMLWNHRDWQAGIVGAHDDWYDWELKQRLLARTPEVKEYQGARENAVALGLLALSIWRHRPPDKAPTVEDLRICSHTRNSRKCPFSSRTLALSRMILMGKHADEELFKKLARKQIRSRTGARKQAPADKSGTGSAPAAEPEPVKPEPPRPEEESSDDARE